MHHIQTFIPHKCDSFAAPLAAPTGASALDKRERKKWQAAMLSRLGAKPDKSPRMPAAIGIGIAKKQAQREAKKLEEAFETGMAQRKGMGKKKREAESAWVTSCARVCVCVCLFVCLCVCVFSLTSTLAMCSWLPGCRYVCTHSTAEPGFL